MSHEASADQHADGCAVVGVHTYADCRPPGVRSVTEELRGDLRAAISNAYYENRGKGQTMESAADDAVDAVLAILALGPVRPVPEEAVLDRIIADNGLWTEANRPVLRALLSAERVHPSDLDKPERDWRPGHASAYNRPAAPERVERCGFEGCGKPQDAARHRYCNHVPARPGHGALPECHDFEPPAATPEPRRG